MKSSSETSEEEKKPVYRPSGKLGQVPRKEVKSSRCISIPDSQLMDFENGRWGLRYRANTRQTLAKKNRRKKCREHQCINPSSYQSAFLHLPNSPIASPIDLTFRLSLRVVQATTAERDTTGGDGRRGRNPTEE
jgi:hypothetical protein